MLQLSSICSHHLTVLQLALANKDLAAFIRGFLLPYDICHLYINLIFRSCRKTRPYRDTVECWNTLLLDFKDFHLSTGIRLRTD